MTRTTRTHPHRRLRLINLALILAMVASLFPWQFALPGPLPDLGPETASAHNLDASAVYVFFDPDTQAYLDNLILTNQRPAGTPLLQSGDELGLIIKAVPDNGTTTGVGGYTTFYVPDGLQVVDVAFVMPGDLNADGITGWDKVPTKGQAQMPSVGAGGGPTVSLVGISRGPNILGTSSAIVTAGNVNLGTLPGVYGDTGVFYSVAPETAYGTYSGGTLKNNSGDTVGWRTNLGTPLNAWDAWQMAAYGIAGTTNPAYPAAALVDSNQRGNAPWGLANVVAGPQSGYAWEFDKPAYDACDPTPTTSPDAGCIDTATQSVGPWQRIKYPGSQFADDPPGANPPVQPYTRGADASQSGFDLTAGDLPQTTGQANGTPNAIRFAFGQLTYNSPEYAWVKVKVHNPAAVLDATGCPVWHVDTFGGDAGGESGGKDHIWRYYDPNSLTFNGCLAIGKPATRELVKVGDYYQYKIKLYNAGGNDFQTIQIQDTLPSGVTYVSAVPAPSSVSLPNLTWTVSPFLRSQMFEATVTVLTKSTGPLVNTVCATGLTTGNETINSCAKETTVSGNQPLLRQSKDVTPTAVAPGGSVQYTITIANIGSGPTGSPVKITEYLPAGFTYTGPLVSATINGANVTGTTTVGGTASQPVFTVPGTLNAGQSLVLVFNAQVSASAEPDSYCNSYTSNQNGINISTGALACVQVAGGKIGDTVWRDWDGDGVQDTGEEGIAGVTVKLYASDGTTLLATTTTDADGHYYFPGLTAGTYVVEVNNGAALAGTTQTGDPDGTFDNRHTVVLTTDQQYLSADFGYEPAGAGVIGDKVFEDIGNDGSFDGADVGIPNVTVWLYEDSNDNGVIDAGDALVATTQSNATGDYSFTGLATGFDYLVKVDKTDPDVQAYFDSAYGLGTPSQLSTAELMASSNLAGSDLDNDFGFWKVEPGSIGDMVFVDADGDGAYDAGETPLASITVELYRDGTLIATTVTGPDGTYLFDNLGPGDYSVEVDTADPDLPGGFFATISHYDKTLAAGEDYLAADFPFVSGLTKTVDKSFADPAGSLAERTLTFTLKPYYPGTDLLENVRIIDPLPTGTIYIASSANAGGTYGAYTPLAAVPGQDLEGGPSGTTQLDTAISVSANFANTGGSVNVTLNVKQNSGSTVNNVAPTDFEVAGGSAACTGPTPATANVPTGATGSNFVWACTLNSAGEFTFHAAAENDTATYSWPEAKSASVLSAPDGGSNVVTWSLGSNVAGVPGETLISGYTAGVYAFRGGNTKEFSKYGISSATWSSKAQPTNGIEKGGSLTTDGAGTIYALEGNSKVFYKYDIATNAWSTLANTSDNANEGGAVQYLNVSGTEYVFATLGGSKRFRRYSVSGNSWTNMADTPENVKKGGALTTDGTYLYAFRGDRKPDFWRYDVGANSWSTLASAPANVGWGGSLTRIGGYIYAFGGNNTANFWRYDIAGNTWSTLASAPGAVNNGGSLTTDGAYIYALQGATKAFWRYDPAANLWTTLASTNFTGNVGMGGALAYDPGLSPVGRFTSMTATPSLISTGDQVTVRLQLQSSTAVTNVIASSLTITPTGGASCGSTTGPTLVSADDDIADANDSVIYQWLCTVAAGSSPGSLTFTAGGTGDGPVSFPNAQSRKVLVSPVLSFQASVNTSGAPAVIENTGLMVETSGAFGSLTSNTTETATAASLGDFVWADGDGDGLQDPGEPGLAGVKVYVDSNNNGVWDPGEPYDVTDANGDYRIYGLTPGSYTVRTDPATYPAGYLPTTASSLNVTLTSGLQYNNADFGLKPAGTGRIGDLVWLDADEDGVLDAGENGLPGITVTLEITVAGAWTPVATTTTDASGLYTFTGLIAGDYRVTVDPASQVTSPYAAGTFDLGAAMDPTYDLDDGTVSPDGVTLVTLATDSTVVSDADFGYNWGGSIGDYVWLDNNANGLQDESPATPIQGAFVMLYYDANNNGVLDPGEYGLVAFDFTDVNGAYLFDNLPPGNYLVDVYEDSITDDGVRDIVPTTGDVLVVTLGPNETYLDADFGYYEGAWVRGLVFHDDDRNAIFDAAENGLTPVTVYLCAAGTDPCDAGSALATTTTDADGNFVFLVPEGDYVVTYDSGDTSAYPDATTPTSYTFHAQPGEDWQQTFEFGVDHSGALGDRVWNDADADGVQDAGEPGLAGVTVSLYQDNDNNGILSAGDTFVTAQVTDANGDYLFAGLPDGDYIVVVDAGTLPAGFTQTYDNFAPLDDTGAATVSGGGAVLDVDFGYQYTLGGASLYTLSGRVYDDLDNSGDDNGGAEPGFAGVDVTVVCTLLGAVTVQTDSNGDWAVAGVPAGDTCTVLNADENDLPRSDYVANETPSTPITVTADVSDLDFGYVLQPGSVSGRICEGSGSGQCDPGDPGVAGITVTLTYAGDDGILGTGDDAVITTTTSITGFYTFTGLEPGLYEISKSNPSNYNSLADADGGNPDSITKMGNAIPLGMGQDAVNRDFELEAHPGLIGDLVWHDLDGDGIQDGGEPGLAGVVVNLRDSGGGFVISTTTDANGVYTFTTPPGDYIVEFEPPTGYEITRQDEGVDDAVDSDADPVTGRTGVITLTAGAVIADVDAGLYQPVTIGDFIFLDPNANAIQDPGETTGVPNVPITLTNLATGAIYNTTSNGSGAYTFTVPPGSYAVSTPAALPGLVRTSPSPATVTLSSGQSDLTLDFGYISPTAVMLASFSAETTAGGVILRWSTSAERDQEGFIVWRAVGETGPYQAVSELILAANAPDGASYTWIDADAGAGAFWYKLQSLPDGAFFGPIPTREDPGSGGRHRAFLPIIAR